MHCPLRTRRLSTAFEYTRWKPSERVMKRADKNKHNQPPLHIFDGRLRSILKGKNKKTNKDTLCMVTSQKLNVSAQKSFTFRIETLEGSTEKDRVEKLMEEFGPDKI